MGVGVGVGVGWEERVGGKCRRVREGVWEGCVGGECGRKVQEGV